MNLIYGTFKWKGAIETKYYYLAAKLPVSLTPQ